VTKIDLEKLSMVGCLLESNILSAFFFVQQQHMTMQWPEFKVLFASLAV